jgi:hypothetical protein
MAKFNAAFRKWFGKSVVRNADGSPKVMYHYGPKKISIFDIELCEFGCHFGTKRQSNDAGSLNTRTGHTHKCYISMQNPFRMQDGGAWGASMLWQFLSVIDEAVIDRMRHAGVGKKEWSEIRRLLGEAGYDGIVYLNRVEGIRDESELSKDEIDDMYDEEFIRHFPSAEDSYLVFHPWQIKSVDNDGTWDRDDLNIGSNPYGDRRVLTREEAEAFAESGHIPVSRTEGYTPRGWSVSQESKGVYYYVADSDDADRLALGKTLIFNTKIDGLLQLGDPVEHVLDKLNYYFDQKDEDMSPEEFLKPYINGKVRNWYGDWADIHLGLMAKRQGADSIILLCEPNRESDRGIGTEVIDLRIISENPEVEDRGPEKFRFLLGVFDVQKAKQILIAKPRKPVTLSLRGISNWFEAVKIDKARAMSDEVDVNMPVIGVFLGEGKEKGFFPIDGWHRMYKANQLGMKEMPMLLLNKRESKSVIIGYRNPDDGLGEA